MKLSEYNGFHEMEMYEYQHHIHHQKCNLKKGNCNSLYGICNIVLNIIDTLFKQYSVYIYDLSNTVIEYSF